MMKTDLTGIPGVGPNIETHLKRLGYHAIRDLAGQSAEEMYARDCAMEGVALDRCLLYVYRLAVYFAEGGREPEKLKWWSWKDTGAGR
jgi:hypothetical protein